MNPVWHLQRVMLLSVLGVAVAGCGGGGGGGLDCTPAPAITSNPPTTATVGFEYQYVINSHYNCFLGLCSSVESLTLPPGAQLHNGLDDYLTWTPQPSDANTDVSFRIATDEDFCGDRATQSWSVHVYPAPVITSFTASPSAIRAGERSSLSATFTGGTGGVDGVGLITSGVPLDTPVLNATRTFTLRVTSPSGGALLRDVAVRVLLPPVITRFHADPVVTVGTTVEMQWDISGDYSDVRLDPGNQPVSGFGASVMPPLGSTTYTLRVTNETGDSDTASAVVQAVAVPVITSFTATPATARLQEAVLLTAEFTGGNGEINDFGPISPGVPVSSGPLARSRDYQLVVFNAAGAAAFQSLTVPLVGPQTFQPTMGQPLTASRRRHSATLLADGRVFIAGGERLDATSSSWRLAVATEIFDPVTESFAAGPDLLEGRMEAAATLLPDGGVLLVGGYRQDATRLLTAELWDPTTNAITSAGTVPVTDMVRPKAVTLADGRALIVHPSLGQGSEVFDLVTGQFSSVGPFQTGHGCIGIERLADGRVLVVDGDPVTSSEIFFPGTDAFALTGSLLHYRCYFNTALLADGRVLVTGGEYGVFDPIPSELYDPVSGSFSETGTRRYLDSIGGQAVTLADGTVLTVGDIAERYDPILGEFQATGSPSAGRSYHTATRLLDGRVLVVGGCVDCIAGGELRSAEIYTP
jgi:hypothetical protein